MGKIHILDKSVSNKIAAGEVVARPASAVKELIENSLDAGATAIHVEIKHGGIAFIRVADNGSGLEEDDILTAFMPHATSKICTDEDLEAIGTYGFRGEALASIAAVSRTEMITRTAEATCGVKITVEGGEYGESELVGAKVGTVITVRDLFFNTPARFKFLKKDAAEAAAVTDVCQKAALSRPDVSFTYVSHGKEVFFTPGDGDLLHAVFAVYGRDFAQHMLPVDSENNGIKIQGFIGTAALSRPSRSMQLFFVNGRSITSKVLSFALSEAYKNQLTVGKFPAAVLNVSIEPSSVDVNVHPSKMEVKFTDEKAVYEALYFACRNTLYEKPYVPSVTAKESVTPRVEAAPGLSSLSVKPLDTAATDSQKQAIKETNEALTKSKGIAPAFFKVVPAPEKTVSAVFSEKESQIPYTVKTNDTPPILIQQQTLADDIKETWTLIGQLFNTYLLIQSGDDMLIIDQHAAHERLNYEQLKRDYAANEVTSQILLTPEVVSLTPMEMAIWKENKAFFHSIGFDIEWMGEHDIFVRSVPSGVGQAEISAVIAELLQMLKDDIHEVRTKKEERAMYSLACKGAIKANRALSIPEQEDLIRRVMALEGINTCPHGRPVCIKISKDKLEKEFKRT